MYNASMQLSHTEMAMMNELFQVMSKYPTTRKFGIQLVHSHFPIKKGEVLYETHDKLNRILKVCPVIKESIKNKFIATSWHQSEVGQIEVAMFCCDPGGYDGGNDGSNSDSGNDD